MQHELLALLPRHLLPVPVVQHPVQDARPGAPDRGRLPLAHPAQGNGPHLAALTLVVPTGNCNTKQIKISRNMDTDMTGETSLSIRNQDV